MNTGQKIMDYLKAPPIVDGISTDTIASHVGVSGNTARKWLYRLEAQGLVTHRLHYYGRGIYLYLWSLAK